MFLIIDVIIFIIMVVVELIHDSKAFTKRMDLDLNTVQSGWLYLGSLSSSSGLDSRPWLNCLLQYRR